MQSKITKQAIKKIEQKKNPSQMSQKADETLRGAMRAMCANSDVETFVVCVNANERVQRN